MSKIYVIERHGNAEYASRATLGKKYGMTLQTVSSYIKEIEAESGAGKRYASISVIRNGKTLLVNVFVFLDWISVRSRWKNPAARKYIKPFNAAEWAAYMGFYNTNLIEVSTENIEELVVN